MGPLGHEHRHLGDRGPTARHEYPTRPHGHLDTMGLWHSRDSANRVIRTQGVRGYSDATVPGPVVRTRSHRDTPMRADGSKGVADTYARVPRGVSVRHLARLTRDQARML